MSETQQPIKLSLKSKDKLKQQFKGQQSVIDGFLGLTESSSINTQSEIVSPLTQSQNLLIDSRIKYNNEDSTSNFQSYAKNKQNSIIQNAQLHVPSNRVHNNNDKSRAQQTNTSFSFTKKNAVKNVSFKFFASNSNTSIQSAHVQHQQRKIGTQLNVQNGIDERLNFQQRFINKNGFDSANNSDDKKLSNQYYIKAMQLVGNQNSGLHNKGKMIKLKKSLSYNPYRTGANGHPQQTHSQIYQQYQQNQNQSASYTHSQSQGSQFIAKNSGKPNNILFQNNARKYIPARAFIKQKTANFNECLSFSYNDRNPSIGSNNSLSKHNIIAKQIQNGVHRSSASQFPDFQNKFRPPLPMKYQLRFSNGINKANNLQNQMNADQKKLRATIGTPQIHSIQFKGQQISRQRISQNHYKLLTQEAQIKIKQKISGSHIKSTGNPKQQNKINPPSTLSISNFQIGLPKIEGKTQFNQQNYVARQCYTGVLVAIKKFKKKNIESHLEQLIQQLKIQMFIDSPNVVKIYGVFSDEQHLYVIQQYMEDGSLYTLMKIKRNLQENQVAEKSLQMARGINALHQKQIIHRKVRPQSVVMTHGVCKIDDFSSATVSDKRRETFYGSYGYTSPQMKLGQSYNQSNDTWCLGIVIYEMINGKPPFYQLSRKDSKRKLPPSPVSFSQKFSKQSVRVLEKMLKANPVQRISIEQALKQNFFGSICDQPCSQVQRQLQLLL